MCGIVGIIASYANGFTIDEGKAFRDMVVVDSLRGFDSTGVFSVENTGNVHLLKEASTGATFVTRDQYDKFANNAVFNGMFMVGHNRAATRGTVNDVNAHPFCVKDNIILVQNGTYRGDHSHHKDTEVDTEAIAWVLHEHPTDIQTALQKINAAYCLVWYNVKDKALYIIRNDERPLYIAYSDTGGVMFASEMETIMLAASRNSIKLKGAPYMIASGMLFKWQLDTSSKTHTFSTVKLDNSFRNIHSPYGKYTNGIDPNAWYNNTPALYSSSKVADRVKQDITIHTYVYDAKFDEYMMDKSAATDIVGDLALRPRDKELTVEFNNYLPANAEADCRTWYLTGFILSTDDHSPSPVVYTMLFDKSEMDVYAMTDKDTLYRVTVPGTPIEHAVQDENKQPKRIITLFCTNLKKVIQNEHTTH